MAVKVGISGTTLFPLIKELAETEAERSRRAIKEGKLFEAHLRKEGMLEDLTPEESKQMFEAFYTPETSLPRRIFRGLVGLPQSGVGLTPPTETIFPTWGATTEQTEQAEQVKVPGVTGVTRPPTFRPDERKPDERKVTPYGEPVTRPTYFRPKTEISQEAFERDVETYKKVTGGSDAEARFAMTEKYDLKPTPQMISDRAYAIAIAVLGADTDPGVLKETAARIAGFGKSWTDTSTAALLAFVNARRANPNAPLSQVVDSLPPEMEAELYNRDIGTIAKLAGIIKGEEAGELARRRLDEIERHNRVTEGLNQSKFEADAAYKAATKKGKIISPEEATKILETLYQTYQYRHQTIERNNRLDAQKMGEDYISEPMLGFYMWAPKVAPGLWSISQGKGVPIKGMPEGKYKPLSPEAKTVVDEIISGGGRR